MSRYHVLFDVATGQRAEVAFTPDEEAAADARVAAKRFRPLNRVQFRFMIRKRGWGAAIEAALDALPDGDQKILAETLYFDGDRFERAHPFFALLAPAVGVTSEDIGTAWLEAMTV